MNFQKLAYFDLQISSHRKIKLNLKNRIELNHNIEHLENQYKHIPYTSNGQQ